MGNWLYLLLGGLAGTAARYGLAGVIAQRVGVLFPWGTLSVNLIGCFMIGFFDVILEKKFSLSLELRMLLIAGFCGALLF